MYIYISTFDCGKTEAQVRKKGTHQNSAVAEKMPSSIFSLLLSGFCCLSEWCLEHLAVARLRIPASCERQVSWPAWEHGFFCPLRALCAGCRKGQNSPTSPKTGNSNLAGSRFKKLSARPSLGLHQAVFRAGGFFAGKQIVLLNHFKSVWSRFEESWGIVGARWS